MRPKKTQLKQTSKDISQNRKNKLKGNMRLNQTIRELVEQVEDSGSTINELLNETDCLAVLNKAKVNNFLNCYITKIFDSLEGVAAINNRLLNKITKRKEVIAPQDYVKMYIKGRELENEQLRLVTEFTKCQDVKLELEEQNMIIIYRSLPDTLKKLMYKTVMEFVRKCPAIQREMQNRKEEHLANQASQTNLQK